jgi:hypothetical protein
MTAHRIVLGISSATRLKESEARHILMLINGLDIHIIHATTGEIIRELILNPDIDYQAQGVRKPRPKPS